MAKKSIYSFYQFQKDHLVSDACLDKIMWLCYGSSPTLCQNI